MRFLDICNIYKIKTRLLGLFFFSSRRRHTRCSRDWSSDVCSSDLEHHGEMRLNQSLLNCEDEARHPLAYACTEPDCLVHYSVYRGYFLLSQDGNTNEPGVVPRVRCPHDGTPMYLAEIDLQKRAFRLWICPQCDRRRTNEEGLI